MSENKEQLILEESEALQEYYLQYNRIIDLLGWMRDTFLEQLLKNSQMEKAYQLRALCIRSHELYEEKHEGGTWNEKLAKLREQRDFLVAGIRKITAESIARKQKADA